MDIKIGAYSGNELFSISILEYNDSGYLFLNNEVKSATTSTPTSLWNYNTTGGGWFNIPIVKIFDPTKFYKLQLNAQIGCCSNVLFWYGSETNTYPFGGLVLGTFSNQNYSLPLDYAFRLFGAYNAGEIEPISSVISIIEPTQATTTATTTIYYEIDYYNRGNATDITLLITDRITNTSDSILDFPINLGSDTATGTIQLLEGSYHLDAVLTGGVSSYGNIIDVDFNVISDKVTEIYGVDIYDPQALLGLATTTCSFTNITGCFQNALIFTFVPSESAFDNFINLKNELATKPPFAYIGLLVNAFQSISDTATPAFTLASEDNITTNIFNPLRSGLTWILWFAFGIFLYKRVKNITI